MDLKMYRILSIQKKMSTPIQIEILLDIPKTIIMNYKNHCLYQEDIVSFSFIFEQK